jgi:hypothetical protein
VEPILMGTIPPPPAPRPHGLMARAGVEPCGTIGRSGPGRGETLLTILGCITVSGLIVFGAHRAATADYDGPTVGRTDIGVVISAEDIPVAFNQHSRTRIECEKAVVFVVGVHSVVKGRRARICRHEGGRDFLQVEGEPYSWLMY